MQEASKRRCNKIKLISLSFVSKLISQKILIKIRKKKDEKLFWELTQYFEQTSWFVVSADQIA